MTYSQHPQNQHERGQRDIYFGTIFKLIKERRRDEHQNQRAQKLRDRRTEIANPHGMIARQRARGFFKGGWFRHLPASLKLAV